MTQILFKNTGNERIRSNQRYSNSGKQKHSDEIKAMKVIN